MVCDKVDLLPQKLVLRCLWYSPAGGEAHVPPAACKEAAARSGAGLVALAKTPPTEGQGLPLSRAQPGLGLLAKRILPRGYPGASRSAPRLHSAATPSSVASRRSPPAIPKTWTLSPGGAGSEKGKAIPFSAARSERRGLPPLSSGDSGGKRGSTTSHSSSLTSRWRTPQG